MRKIMIAAGALFALAASSSTASAQWNSNRIVNSGNGAYNTINAQNYGGGGFGFPGGFGGYNSNHIINSGNGVGNSINAQNFGGGGFGFPGGGFGYPGGGFGQPGGFGGFGGYNSNRIINSGNGIGNTINAQNFGGGWGGVNRNVIVGSGNGFGNVINAGNW